MKRVDWRYITELIGIISIVASLLFVSLQLKQAQEIAIANQYQERTNASLEIYSAFIQSDLALAERGHQILAWVSSGSASPAIRALTNTKSPDEIGFWFYTRRISLTSFDNSHYQYESGYMAEESWQAFRARLQTFLSDEATADIYRRQHTAFRESFQNLCDQLLVEIDSERD